MINSVRNNKSHRTHKSYDIEAFNSCRKIPTYRTRKFETPLSVNQDVINKNWDKMMSSSSDYSENEIPKIKN